jgi:DTW domain-containing protein YfiP
MMLLLLLMLFVLLLFIMMCIYLLLSDEVYLCNTDRVLSSTQSVCCVVFDNKRNKDVNFGLGF